jgi:hypothetical protein
MGESAFFLGRGPAARILGVLAYRPSPHFGSDTVRPGLLGHLTAGRTVLTAADPTYLRSGCRGPAGRMAHPGHGPRRIPRSTCPRRRPALRQPEHGRDLARPCPRRSPTTLRRRLRPR